MRSDLKEQVTAWGFLTPALLVLAVFGLFPIGYAFYVSLHRWTIKKEALIGLGHYTRALGEPAFLLLFLLGVLLIAVVVCLRRRPGAPRAPHWILLWAGLLLLAVWLFAQSLPGMFATGDPRLYNGFRVTLFYTLGTIPAQLSIAMGLAYLLFKSLRGKGFFRVLYVLP